ncbi:bifunctional precorrin-2 dehydrogenase/sirohydrochlorin ferrochelatase [Robiginitalea sp. SC105]|uniref:precorrin-2 dehydrogenase/sirohydrochlorin ferrochelatase family protein n=1 Tax=Robiginitalea sp. SC105 TaxID=2762332 RepID=UPI001639827F|nr:bifunctional precorrin-2 dehydrogenase/sirohydrochlorin ferrochelatase [Robiginitalea sp. SC105]MBC2838934.1 bifunctional precorrin-2 dehydrogenase/sirohydrochlorin ferrochelatase [Robiginitalea sp. SC105]
MDRNNLYPIFLKCRTLDILIVGGGNVAEEKLFFLTKSSPDARVTLVAPFFREGTLELAAEFGATTILGEYHPGYLQEKHLVIATTDKPEVNEKIFHDCRQRHILVNVADNPPLCDFYMGGIVTKGHVKIAISTNGQSPTTAKRLRQFFEAVLPEDISRMVEYLNAYRKTLRGDFEEKVNEMNKATRKLVAQKTKI